MEGSGKSTLGRGHRLPKICVVRQNKSEVHEAETKGGARGKTPRLTSVLDLLRLRLSAHVKWPFQPETIGNNITSDFADVGAFSLSRLIGVAGGGGSSQYQYDGDGNRILQQAGASVYQYAMDVARRYASVLNENGPDGNIDFQYGLSLLSGSSATLEQFYQTDGVGSTRHRQ